MATNAEVWFIQRYYAPTGEWTRYLIPHTAGSFTHARMIETLDGLKVSMPNVQFRGVNYYTSEKVTR